jgi:thiamine-phosphate diphosphorylase
VNRPRLIVITDRTQAAGDLTVTLARAIEYGARAILLRDRDLPAPHRKTLADRVRPMLAAVDGWLIVAAPVASDHLGAVHLTAAQSMPDPRPAMVGRSCHSQAEVDRAVAERCDYVLVSPIYPTVSKPGYGPSLGTRGLAALVRVGPPAYALGGVSPETVADCRAAGSYGVAVMGPIMRDPSLIPAYLKELGA